MTRKRYNLQDRSAFRFVAVWVDFAGNTSVISICSHIESISAFTFIRCDTCAVNAPVILQIVVANGVANIPIGFVESVAIAVKAFTYVGLIAVAIHLKF